MKDFNFQRFNFEPSQDSQQAVSTYYRQQFSRNLALFKRNGLTQSQFHSLAKDSEFSAEHLSKLRVKQPTASARSKTKIHKRHNPVQITNSIKFKIGKDLSAPLGKYDFNLNPYIRELRVKKRQRLNIRDESEEILKALFPAFIKYCDYSIYSEFLFEVKAPLRQIAYEIGLLENTERYDRLHRAIDILQEAGLIVVINEFDKDLYRQRALRIFLLPDFFYSIGHTPEKLKSMVASLDRFYTKKGRAESIIARNEAHEERIKLANVADIRGNAKNLAFFYLLKNVRKRFLADPVFRKADNFSQKVAKKTKEPMKPTISQEKTAQPMSEEKRRAIFENLYGILGKPYPPNRKT